MLVDNRLIGTTSENLFLSLLNQNGVFAHSFDSASFDGIVFDLKKRFFKIGPSPSFVQIKCRGSSSEKFSLQGHSPETIEAIRHTANELEISEESLYLVLGFFRNRDIRQAVFYIVPFGSLPKFRKSGQYRFSAEKCERMSFTDSAIVRL
jgi:hypothetical protein